MMTYYDLNFVNWASYFVVFPFHMFDLLHSHHYSLPTHNVATIALSLYHIIYELLELFRKGINLKYIL